MADYTDIKDATITTNMRVVAEQIEARIRIALKPKPWWLPTIIHEWLVMRLINLEMLPDDGLLVSSTQATITNHTGATE